MQSRGHLVGSPLGGLKPVWLHRLFMQVTVNFFSFFRPITGTDQMTMDLPEGATLGDLLKSLDHKFSTATFTAQKFIVMVNRCNAFPETELHAGDDVLLLPILGGG